MNRLIAWTVGNPVAANLLMVLVVVGGLASGMRVRQETFPNIAFDFVSIQVPYPGAAPDEVEESICMRIEEEVHDIPGVERVFSSAREGFGAVWVKVVVGDDPRRVLEDVRTRMDTLDTLPEEAERPIVQELVDDHVLLTVFVHGRADDATLHGLGEELRDGISALPEISRAELVGVRPRELAIEVSETALRRHGITFANITEVVRRSSLSLPGGALETAGGEIRLRMEARARTAHDFERIVILTRPDGTRLRLGDVARVTDDFADTHEFVRFDGQPAVAVRLLTSERKNVLAVAGAVQAHVASARAALPEGVSLTVWDDESRDFRGRRDLLLRSGGQGLLLILLILAIFMPPRLGFWVSLGIPISFLGAMIVLAMSGVSINMMSLFAFIVALGLVVDDAIVIGESVSRHRKSGSEPRSGAIRGAQEVALPVTIAVATTILFLAPALFLPTVIGKVTRSLAVVTIGCLVFSVVEALFILPSHLAGGRLGSATGRPSLFQRLRERMDVGLDRFISGVYRPLLGASLRRPGLTLAFATVALVWALAALSGGWVKSGFFPSVEADVVTVELVMPEGTPHERVEAAVAQIVSHADALGRALSDEADGTPMVEHVMVAIGDPPDRHDDFKDGGDGPNVARVRLQLTPAEQRRIGSMEIAERWRERVPAIPGAESLRFRGSDLFDVPALELSLSARDPVVLESAVRELRVVLEDHPTVIAVTDTLRLGKQELRLAIRPEAESLGMTPADLAHQVRQGFHGEEVQRLQRGRDDVAVLVRYPLAERRSLRNLNEAWIRLPDGGELPFPTVAKAEHVLGPATIERRDLKRNVTLTADVDRSVGHEQALMAELEAGALPEILARHKGVVIALDGQSREQKEFEDRIMRDWLLALLAAFALLAVPLRSYVQPILILAAVPFGFVGAIAGHALLGLEFSAFSHVGLVALTGVVLNDALVLMDRANRQREAGLSLHDALCEAGATRFRAIFLTTLTTFFGLLPLMFERSAQAAWLQPMAASLAFGVIFATAITLLLIPAACVAADDLGQTIRRAFPTASDPTSAAPSPPST